MSCRHCGAAHQRGRFCFRCGKKLLPAVSPRPRNLVRTSLARPAWIGLRAGHPAGDTTGKGTARPSHAPGGPVGHAAREDGSTSDPATRRRIHDTVMERAAGAASPAFQRYLSVLIAAS